MPCTKMFADARQCLDLIRLDLLLLHRERNAFGGSVLFSIFVVAAFTIAGTLSTGRLSRVIDPRISLLITSLAIAQGFHGLYDGWGITFRHATMFALSARRFVGMKNIASFLVILFPNTLALGCLTVIQTRSVEHVLPAFLLATDVSASLLIAWNWWYRWPPTVRRQEILLFMVSFAVAGTIIVIFGFASAIHPWCQLIFTTLLLMILVWYARSYWPDRLIAHRFMNLEVIQ